MIYIIIILVMWLFGCLIINYYYSKNLCLEYRNIQNLIKPRRATVIPVVTGVIVEDIPRNGIIVTINIENETKC